MSKFASYFFNLDEETKPETPPVVAQQKPTFPASTTFPAQATVTQAPPAYQPQYVAPAPVQPVVIGSTSCEPQMAAIMELYQAGFVGLNKPGVDFFEFFEAVMNADPNDPRSYSMAFKMLKGLEPNLTKTALLDHAQFYVNELNTVHTQYDQQGKTKKSSIEENKRVEQEQLKSDLAMIEDQIRLLTSQANTKRDALTNIDGKYNPLIEDVMCKLAANDVARNNIQTTIERVINGVNANIQ